MIQPLLPLLGYAARGPHPVGVTTLELFDQEDPSRKLPTDVWYPADPARFEDSPAADHPLGADHDAHRDAAPAALAAALPLVAFSHGNAGFRRQSTFLTSHLASWGMVVTAPDHTGNTFFEMFEVKDDDERIRIRREARRNRPADVSTAIEAVITGGDWPGVDPQRIGTLGHSYGGWTALKMPARDARIRAVCGLAPASEPFVGKRAFEAGELPLACPSLIFPALEDVLVDIDTSIRPLFERLEQSALVGVRNADHFHFCDLLALIHGLHEKNGMRPKQTRPTRPYADLLEEVRTQRLVRAVVTGFFAANLGPDGSQGVSSLSPSALASVDTHLTRLDRGAA
jgi:predicted dienelactone hydrolase